MYFSCRLLRRQRGIQPCDLYALLRFSASAQAEGTFHVFCLQCFLQRSAGLTERAIQFADSVRRSLCDSHATFFYIWGGKKLWQLECILIMKNSQFSGLRNCALLFWPLFSRASLEDFHGAAKNALPLERSDPNHNHVSRRMCEDVQLSDISLLDGNINALVLEIPFKHPSQRTLVIKLFLLPQLECDSTKAALNSSVAPWKGFKYSTTSLFSIYVP